MKYLDWLDSSHGAMLRYLMCLAVGVSAGIEAFKWLITESESPLAYVGRYFAGFLGAGLALMIVAAYVKLDRTSREQRRIRGGEKP